MGFDMTLYRTKKVADISEVNYKNCDDVCDWRKFNALHNWFVENCQNGIDECQYSFVSKEQLVELLAILNQLTPENCSELFPTQDGFFFGSTDYNDWYWEDVKQTREILPELIENFDWENESLVYASSW